MDERTAKQDFRWKYASSPDGIHLLGDNLPTYRRRNSDREASKTKALKNRAEQLEAGVIGYCFACGIQIYADRLPCRESLPCCLNDCPVTSARPHELYI